MNIISRCLADILTGGCDNIVNMLIVKLKMGREKRKNCKFQQIWFIL